MGLPRATCCSEKCRANKRLLKKNAGIKHVDYIECPICKSHVKQITSKHAKMHGYIDATDMQQQLSMRAITCSSVKDNNSGDKNPAYDHKGKYSKFSKSFIHGYDKGWHDNLIELNKKNREAHPEAYPNHINYWINKCDGDIVKGTEAYRLYQTRDINFFINKYGEKEGLARHTAKTAKWIKSCKHQNFSKISQELFNELIKHLPVIDNIYYATFDRIDMKEYKNKEYRLPLADSYILPDFIDLISKKIIEFDGEYWHGATKANPAREARRDMLINANGYTVLHISEVDYKKNKEETIAKCMNFLIQ
jgi:very-short-patch-repair endonuclease